MRILSPIQEMRNEEVTPSPLGILCPPTLGGSKGTPDHVRRAVSSMADASKEEENYF